MRWLAQTITPFKVKGTGIRQKSKPHPDFSLFDTIILPSAMPEPTLPRSLSVVSNEDDPWMVSALYSMSPNPDTTTSSLRHMVDTTPLMEELITGGGVDHVDYSKNDDDWHWEEVESAMYDLVHQPAGISFDRFLQDLAVEARIQT